MNIEAVANELRDALKTTGLSVPEWGVQRIHPPAAVVSLPETVTYDQTYGRGSDELSDVVVLVLVANPAQPSARRAIAEYADGSGPRSVKAAIEQHTYTSCDDVTVTRAEFDAVTYAGTEYLGAMFHIDITGRGA